MFRLQRFAPVAVLALLAAACGSSDDDAPVGPSQPRAAYSQTDLRVGTGADAVNGRTITVNYTGWLYDPAQPEQKGRQFDTSIGRGPFAFVLGTGRVIAGWDRGVAGMKVGGQRRLVLPPDLGYGAAGSPPSIPGDASLVFDVELLAVQ